MTQNQLEPQRIPFIELFRTDTIDYITSTDAITFYPNGTKSTTPVLLVLTQGLAQIEKEMLNQTIIFIFDNRHSITVRGSDFDSFSIK